MGLGIVRLNDAVEVVSLPREARFSPVRLQGRLGHAEDDDDAHVRRQIGVDGNGALGYASGEFLRTIVGEIKILGERTA